MAGRREDLPLLDGSGGAGGRGGRPAAASSSSDEDAAVPAARRRGGSGFVTNAAFAVAGSLVTVVAMRVFSGGTPSDLGERLGVTSPPVDCEGRWSSWSTCSTTCGAGMRKRTFEVRRAAANGGHSCQYSDGAWSAERCSNGPCPGTEGYLASAPLCNEKVPLPVGNWTEPREFDLPAWMKYCYEPYMQPWDEFVWPGRNWCWARTKAKGCYANKGGLPPWWWAQKWAKGAEHRVPAPEEYVFPGLVNPDLCDRIDHGAPLRDVSNDEADLARVWIRKNLGIYVINLKWSTQRWEAMQARLAALGLEGERIDGIDMRAPGALEQARRDGFVPSEEEFNLDKAWKIGRELMAHSNPGFGHALLEDWIGIGTIGCAAAHLHAQVEAHLRASKAGKPLTLIMEDDIWLQDDFIVKLYRLLTDEAPCDWDVIALSSRCPYGTCVSTHLSRVQVDGNEPKENCHGEVQYGMFAMLYRTVQLPEVHEKLKRRIWSDDQPGCVPPDVAMSAISGEIAYYAVPGNQMPGYVVEAASSSNRLGMNR